MCDIKIFTENIEMEALSQIQTFIEQPAFEGCKVRIMPDVHGGVGCVIGFTANLGDKVIPNIVGSDIGCGMLCVELENNPINPAAVDSIIRKFVPSGRNVHKELSAKFPSIKELRCFSALKDVNRIERSIGTLGGGNHFIEIDTDNNGVHYLIIHSGSRNLGKQVAKYYQDLAIKTMHGNSQLNSVQEQLITVYIQQGRQAEISSAIAELRRKFTIHTTCIPKELCYLTGKNRDDYLHDMKICQDFACFNRNMIAFNIIMNLPDSTNLYFSLPMFDTVHNYIEHDTNMVRKGAISAKRGEKLLIPLNMRDGCIIGIGKGNEDWNCSAPHGAGRIMSRNKAKQMISLDEFEKSMNGIFTTSVNSSTLDESPMVYKPMQEIMSSITDTVEIQKIIKPIYNYKSSEQDDC